MPIFRAFIFFIFFHPRLGRSSPAQLIKRKHIYGFRKQVFFFSLCLQHPSGNETKNKGLEGGREGGAQGVSEEDAPHTSSHMRHTVPSHLIV